MIRRLQAPTNPPPTSIFRNLSQAHHRLNPPPTIDRSTRGTSHPSESPPTLPQTTPETSLPSPPTLTPHPVPHPKNPTSAPKTPNSSYPSSQALQPPTQMTCSPLASSLMLGLLFTLSPCPAQVYSNECLDHARLGRGRLLRGELLGANQLRLGLLSRIQRTGKKLLRQGRIRGMMMGTQLRLRLETLEVLGWALRRSTWRMGSLRS